MKAKTIAIAGNIGSGKTTLTSRLSQELQWQAFFEPQDTNPYLSLFYKDMKPWAFHLQMSFMIQRARKQFELQEKNVSFIQDRTLDEDYLIFTKNLFDLKMISEEDYRLYSDYHDFISKFIRPPDLLIYLRSSVDRLLERIKLRARESEQSISIEYLKRLNTHYEQWISQYNHSPYLVVDVSDKTADEICQTVRLQLWQHLRISA